MKSVRKLLPALLLLAVLVMTGCGLAGSETNEIGLVYEGGMVQDKTYRGILKPGSTSNSVGLGSEVYRYRIDQRSYIAGKDGDTAPVQVVSKDDVRMLVDYQLYFTLNQAEKVLKKFHERLGRKTDAWTEEGWDKMLREYFAPQIERSLESAALQHNWRDLYGSENARRQFQDQTVAALKTAIKTVIGDDYFCGPSYDGHNDCGDYTFTVGKPTPVNADIVTAIEAEQKAVAQTIAQEQTNQRIAKELEAERNLVALYGPQWAVLREAVRSGKLQSIILDPTGRVTVPVPKP